MDTERLFVYATFLICAAAAKSSDHNDFFPFTQNNSFENFSNYSDALRTFLRKLPRGTQVALLNDYTDDLLHNLNRFIYERKLDPVNMPDIVNKFQWKIMFITYHGEMSLTTGWLQGLKTIKRRDHTLLWYQYPNIKVEFTLGFEDLMFDYNYVAKFMGLGPSGGVHGKVRNCQWSIAVDFNLITLQAQLERYNLDRLGDVSLKFSGGIFDWLVNIFVSVTVPFVKPVVKFVLEAFIGNGIETVISVYNYNIRYILQGYP